VLLLTMWLVWSSQHPTTTSTSVSAAANSPRPQLPVVAPAPAVVPTLGERIQPHLDWADQQCQLAIDRSLADLALFFTEARQRAPAWAAEALSWRSKWACLVDTLPLTSGERLRQRLRELFAHHLFIPAQLEQQLRRVWENYLADVRNIESRMLVALQADLADQGFQIPWREVEAGQALAAYEQALASVTGTTEQSLHQELASQSLSLVAGEILVLAGARLTTSAGIVGVGGATSWSTFGAGLLAGLIVDQIVSAVWDWWADPQGDLSDELCRRLTAAEQQLVTGDGQTPGLRDRLREFARERSAVRERAVWHLLQPEAAERNAWDH